MKIKKIGAFLSAVVLALSLPVHIPVHAAEESAETVTETVEPEITTNSIAGWPQGPEITSGAGIILETSTNTVLYGKNMDAPLFPGSNVKIMTILLALENSNLSDEVTMTATGVMGITDGGVSISAQLDEVFTMEQCLYAVMLASANDVCLQIAEHIGGTVDGFVEMMNERAASLGCTNTVFTNPTGLPDDAQHTTAHDMALIMQAALENETFRTILSAQSYTIPATNVSGGERALTNPFEMLNSQDASYYEGCIGGKRGFTNASGETLVCAAERNDMTLICVLLQGTSSTTPSEAGTLLDYGFNNFSLLDIGKDDFDVQSGGIVLAPAGATADSFTTEDTETEDGTISRTYLYQNVAVGTSICKKDAEESSAAFAANESNLQAAKDYSADQSMLPYAIIGGVGGVLFLILLFLFIRTLKA